MFLQVAQTPDLVNTNYNFYFCPVGVFHTLNNVQLSDKYEILLKEMCWNDAYLILGQYDQYVGNYNNNERHISSVEIHIWVLDIHIL